MVKTTVEQISGTVDSDIIIKSAEEFKEKIKIPSIPDGDLMEYFKEPIRYSEKELEELRKSYLNEKPNLGIIKSSLEKKRNAIIEASKQGLNGIKDVAGDIKEAISIRNEGDDEQESSQIEAEKAINTAEVAGQKIGGKTGEVIKKGTEMAKSAVSEGSDIINSSKALLILEKAKEEGGLLGFFAGLLLSFFKILGYGKVEDAKEKAGDAKEKIEEKLTQENIDLTKNHIKTFLIETFPGEEKYISTILDNPKILTEEKIKLFYGKIKAGEKITLKDLTEDFKELEISKLLEEKSKKAEELLFAGIRKEIETKYNKNLDNEQIIALRKLVSTFLTVDKSNIEFLEKRIVIDSQVQLKDVIPVIKESGKNTIGFMIGLVSEKIISVSDLAMDFADAGWNTIQISLGMIGLSEIINLDDFYSSISEMGEKEKAILIGLLYRKGGLFLNIVGSLTAGTSKLLIETVLPTNSGVDGIKLFKDSLLNGNLKQVENFEKIEKALSGSKVTSEGTAFLKEAVSNLGEVKKNFAVLDIMENSKGNIDDFYKQLADFESKTNIKLGIEKYASFEELKTGISNKMSVSYATKHNLDIRDIKNKGLGFGSNSAIQEFNKKLENIAKHQSRIALGKINLNPLKKLTDAIDISKVSKLGDSLVFELRSKNDAKAFLKQLNEMAKKSPELIKGIFDKLPIIAIGGLAATGEESFFENIKNEIPYLIPLFGPILMVSDSGVDWKSFPPKFIKPGQTAIAGALLTLDGFFLLKEKGIINKMKYLGKPIKDVYDIGKGTVEVGQRLYKTGRVLENGKTIEGVFKNALTKTKGFKGKAKAIAIIGLIGYGAFEYALANDNTTEFEKYKKDGKLDIEKIKSDPEGITKEEKIELVKLLIVDEGGDENISDLTFKFEGEKSISIVSNNEKIQSDWFISNDTKENLYHLFGIEKFLFEYIKNPA